MNWVKPLGLLRRAARVERMHIQPTSRAQTVGEHTFNVLVLINYVYPQGCVKLWRAALFHDAAEAVTGDVPATAKKHFSGLHLAIQAAEDKIELEYLLKIDLDTVQQNILKFCDIMELAIHCVEEAERGDRNTVAVAYRCIDAVEAANLTKVTPQAYELFCYVALYLSNHFPTKGVLFND